MRREQVFWGWGEPGAGPALPEHAVAFLRDELGIAGAVVDRPVALDEVRLREPALDPRRARAGWRRSRGEVRDDREARVLRCRGKSYLDLLAQRAGDVRGRARRGRGARRPRAGAAVLQVCAEAGVAVVPFGGGTSVVGGLEPLRGPFEALVSLDLGRMDRVLAVDARSLTAVLEPGLRLPEADRALGAHGLTLGHVPQSYEWATVGGCVATRSAGQASTGHGRIDENLVAVALRDAARRAGDAATRRPAPPGRRCASWWSGREGALGVITRGRAARAPAAGGARYEGWFVPGFEAGCEALRRARAGGRGAGRRAAVGRGRDALHARASPGAARPSPRRARRRVAAC